MLARSVLTIIIIRRYVTTRLILADRSLIPEWHMVIRTVQERLMSLISRVHTQHNYKVAVNLSKWCLLIKHPWLDKVQLSRVWIETYIMWFRNYTIYQTNVDRMYTDYY